MGTTGSFQYPHFDASPAPEVGAAAPRRVPLVVIGAGPVGLCAAIDAAQQGLPVLLLDEDHTVSLGSRGLCYAQRSLQVLDRLGVGEPVVAKGVTWNVGRTFSGSEEVLHFKLLPEPGHRRPGMVNLQQYWLEHYLVQHAQAQPGLELRWQHTVQQVQPQPDGALIAVHTSEGAYTLHADWVIVADGAKSPVRRQLGLDIAGQVFQDRFLIADVRLDGELFPADRTERWFWFDPPFHSGQSVLLHREADDTWRADFQLGWDADPQLEKQPERVLPRVRALLDHQGFSHVGFRLEWASVYTFQCRRMKAFRHGRLLFAGDAAHQLSPFGARGANSGMQDVDNLVWKLAAVLRGEAPDALLESYGHEREAAADENIGHSTRATDFITPKSHAAQVLRQAVLGLAREASQRGDATHFARLLINSGRLSMASHYANSPLNTPVQPGDAGAGTLAPGSPLPDAPLQLEDGTACWLLTQIPTTSPAPGTARFTLITATRHGLLLAPWPTPDAQAQHLLDPTGTAHRRLGLAPGGVLLVRPDQHLAARWPAFDAVAVAAAHRRALGHAH